MATAIRTYQGVKISSGSPQEVDDVLTVEAPLTIQVNGENLTVTMQTPGDELALTQGLLCTEGIWRKSSPLPIIEIKSMTEAGIIETIDVTLDPEIGSLSNKRSLLSVSACGVCGKTSFEIPQGQISKSKAPGIVMLDRMYSEMKKHQNAFLQSGGSHAAALFQLDGEMVEIKEDIGRHNAVDKVIGAAIFADQLKNSHFLLVSGRVSYEIVTKCFKAGIPVLAAVSAPSTLAVDFAKELGITLLGFCREGRATIYS